MFAVFPASDRAAEPATAIECAAAGQEGIVRHLGRVSLACVLALAGACRTLAQQKPPLLAEETVAALAGELSGETAKRNLEYLSRLHRTRGSQQFRRAAEHIAAQLRSYGIAGVKIEEFPADGKIWYGTQRSRPAWEAEFAELWELRREQRTAPCGAKEDQWVRDSRVASWDAEPITLAQDSESGEVTAALVDVGTGTRDADYAGKDVRGRLVLVSAQPGAVAELAVGKHGAAGIISYAQNQPQAWHGDDADLIRWGHLETFSSVKTFAFMISPRRARNYQARMAAGETIMLEAKVKAGQRPGSYDIVSATLPGADEKLKNEEIVFTCHLDHPRPGANDNASGCVTILEVARTLQKLITERRIPRPARTIRFLWPPEIEGSIVYLNARPEIAARFKTNIHMDMVGGGPETKAVFHVTRGPASVPSFVNDVAETFGEFVNQQSYQFAATGAAKYPLIAAEGGKGPLLAQLVPFTEGSDHQVFAEGSWRIPTVYLNDWPDRYIHTNKDTATMIDPTKLKRAGFIGAATGYFLAGMNHGNARQAWEAIAAGILRRQAFRFVRRAYLTNAEVENLERFSFGFDVKLLESLAGFVSISEIRAEAESFLGKHAKPGASLPPMDRAYAAIFERSLSPKGPMSGFGYSYLADKLGTERMQGIRLLRYEGLWGSGSDYAFEALNFVDGRRSVDQIAGDLAAVYGPVPADLVHEYLRALESIGVIREKK